jgi:hypothetical protein
VGFTPVKWESRKKDSQASEELGRSNCYKADPSLKSFVFTLKNPQNFPARKFALKAEKKEEAIFLISSAVHAFMTFLLPITATQTPPPAVTVPLASLTRTTPAWTGKLFSPVRSDS